MDRILIVSVVYLALYLAACRPPANVPATERVDVGITPMLSTQAAADDSIFPIVTTPVSTQTQIVCDDAPPQRLIVLERGQVTDDDDETLNLRSGPGVSFEIITALDPGALFFVLDGPTCTDGFLWYRVQHDTFTGWLAEGDTEAYYTIPYLTG